MDKIFFLVSILSFFISFSFEVPEPRDRSRGKRKVGRKPHCLRHTPSGDRQPRAKHDGKARKQRKEVRLMKAYN